MKNKIILLLEISKMREFENDSYRYRSLGAILQDICYDGKWRNPPLSYVWIMSHLEKTITDFTNHRETFTVHISSETLNDIEKYLRLAKLYLLRKFEDEVARGFHGMNCLPFSIQLKIARYAQINIPTDIADAMLLQGLAYIDEGIGVVRLDSPRAFESGIPWLLRGHFQCHQYLRAEFPHEIEDKPCYQYQPRRHVGFDAFRSTITCGESEIHARGTFGDSVAKTTPFSNDNSYTIEHADGTYEYYGHHIMFDIIEWFPKYFDGIMKKKEERWDFPEMLYFDEEMEVDLDGAPPEPQYSVTFTNDFIIAWIRKTKAMHGEIDSEYKDGFYIRQIPEKTAAGTMGKRIDLPGLEEADGEFYTTKWIKENMIAISYIAKVRKYTHSKLL